jgi:GDP-L-fucose synthase
MKLVQAHRTQYGARYISVVPGDMFGPGDDFEPETAHVVPALVRRAHEAVEENAGEIIVWGSGRPVRDLVFVDDVARALIFAAERYDDDLPLNVGSGSGTSIQSLAHTICDLVGFQGRLRFDPDKPDGIPIKVLDSSRLEALGYQDRTPIRQALSATLRWWREREER